MTYRAWPRCPAEPPDESGGRVARAVFERQVLLEAAGCTLDDVVDVTTFHTDPDAQFETVRAVRDRVIGQPPYPTWTAVGAKLLYGFDFEIKAIARIPPKSSTTPAPLQPRNA